MAYKPLQPDFSFSPSPYQPATDFYFQPESVYPFIRPPSVVSHYLSRWDIGESQQRPFQASYSDSLTRNRTVLQTSHKAERRDSRLRGVFWGRVPRQEILLKISHGSPEDRRSDHASHWRQPAAKEQGNRSGWDASITAHDRGNNGQWQQARVADRDQSEAFNRVDEFGAAFTYQAAGYEPPSTVLLDFLFDGRRYTPGDAPAVYFRFARPGDSHPIQPRDQSKQQAYSSNRAEDDLVRIPWGLGQKAEDEKIDSGYGGETEPLPPKQEPAQPEIRESYLFMNTVSVVTLPDRIAIDLRSLEISLDIDSFSWAISAELWGAASLALVEPDSDGPKQIEVDINGWLWVFIIERYSSNRQFGEERYSIYGASRTQLLAAPYAPLRSKSSSSAINAKQAITEELQNTGFTATYPSVNEYSTPDWIIPGGSFSYQGVTPMKVISRLAGTAGSVIIPSRDSDALAIQPRYQSSPWGWGSATMDRVIPAAMVVGLSASWRPEPQYNAVYVSGTHTGVAVNVKRQGTAGDERAPDIFEDWLTETQVNTERGRNELSKGGGQSVTSLELPLTDTSTAPGLIEPGELIEVQDITGNWRGLCLGVSIRSAGGKVTQSIELERHY